MTAVATLVRDALLHLCVIDPRQPVQNEDMQTGIRFLNLMMRELETDGLSVGWSEVSNPSETLPVPPETEIALGYMLAIRLQPQFGVEAKPTVIALATQGEATLSAQVANQTFSRVEYPDLPAGVGRNRGYGWRNGLNG